MTTPAERATGSFPLSIATSLAIEGSLGIHPDHPAGEKLLGDFNELWVNLKTLFRNYHNAVGRDNYDSTKIQEHYTHFEQEMESLEKVVNSETSGKVRVVYYLPNYDRVASRFPHALMRKDTTDIQKQYTARMKALLTMVVNNKKEQIKIYSDLILRESGRAVLLLTSYPIDLTTSSFSSIALLESHTGNIKQRNQWYTKFYDGKELASIPFTQGSLTIFGDNEMFRPLPISYRKSILELAKKYNWSFATTWDKITYGLNTLKDRYLAEHLKIWLNAKL